MDRQFKSWGEKWSIFLNDTCEVSVLYLSALNRCSWHKHQSKYNLFFVVQGTIEIKTEWGIATVDQCQIFTTKPGEWHEFRTTNSDAIVIECMYVQYDHSDIERATLGGPLEDGNIDV